MTDSRIKVGDVCIDLIKRGKVVVVGKAADTVAEHQDREEYDIADYKGNALLDMHRGEPVYTVVFCPDAPSTSFSGTYDMPRSRLARVPVEAANDALLRPQHELATQLAASLLAAYEDHLETDPDSHPLEGAIRDVLGAELAEVVFDSKRIDDIGGGEA